MRAEPLPDIAAKALAVLRSFFKHKSFPYKKLFKKTFKGLRQCGKGLNDACHGP